MPPTTIRTAPALDTFTFLADHQSQTPTSFFGAKPVLHYHATSARALIPKDQVLKLPIFTAANVSAQEDESDAATGGVLAVERVEVFVSSDNLTLFNSSISTGVSIPYPAISLHAIQRLPDPSNPSEQVQGLYMQLELEAEQENSYDDEPESIEITILTSTSDSADAPPSSTQALFEAVSSCSNLHPDPVDQEDEDMEDLDSRIVFEGSVGYEGISGLPGAIQGASDGGLPPPFPGSGGWITAENVGEYFDADGNWIGEADSEPLGEGAGRVRGRDEVDVEGSDTAVVNGNGENGVDDHKRSRTE